MCSDFGEAGFGLLGSRLRGLGVLGLWIWGLIRVEGLGVRFSEGLLGPSSSFVLRVVESSELSGPSSSLVN